MFLLTWIHYYRTRDPVLEKQLVEYGKYFLRKRVVALKTAAETDWRLKLLVPVENCCQ